MGKNDTITIQELRRDPVGFLRQVNKGKTMTVIYRSRPFATVVNAEKAEKNSKSMQRMLEYAELARSSARRALDPTMSYKDAYDQDVNKKYDIS